MSQTMTTHKTNSEIDKMGRWIVALVDLEKVTKTWRISFCFAYQTGLMTNRQRELKFPVVGVLRVFTTEGAFFDIRNDDTSSNPGDFLEIVEQVSPNRVSFFGNHLFRESSRHSRARRTWTKLSGLLWFNSASMLAEIWNFVKTSLPWLFLPN